LCTCCRQYPGAAAGRNPRSSHPAVAAFPDSAVGSACTSTFSRLAWRSLALRPAHSRGHQVVTAIRRLQPFRYLHDCSDCFRLERSAGWALHPLESAAFSRRTPIPAIPALIKRGRRPERDTRQGVSRSRDRRRLPRGRDRRRSSVRRIRGRVPGRAGRWHRRRRRFRRCGPIPRRRIPGSTG
jgi:hypothetical protein